MVVCHKEFLKYKGSHNLRAPDFLPLCLRSAVFKVWNFVYHVAPLLLLPKPCPQVCISVSTLRLKAGTFLVMRTFGPRQKKHLIIFCVVSALEVKHSKTCRLDLLLHAYQKHLRQHIMVADFRGFF